MRFETNKVIGKTFTVAQLLGAKGFDAVFLGVGAGAPAFLGIPGEFAGQVYSANEFLTRVNLMGGDVFPLMDTPVGVGRSAVVIGAGNTAMDCLRVARRLGVATVRCVYRRSEAEAPARKEELRHAKEEGVDFFFLHAPVAILVNENGDVQGIRLEEMELGEPDGQGRRKPVATGRLRELPCDTVIYALGTKANPIITKSTPGLQINQWGNIVADETTQATALPGVFAGGDIVTGGATVILAMGAGRRAAKAIASYLQKGKIWPLTAEDVASFEPLAPESAGKRCPKCQQPIEDDEAYVCCADAQLQWQCTECAKISEGFAFPYGMCPLCGGKLEARSAQGPANQASLQAIRVAFEIELGGQAFYKRAAQDAPEPELATLFQKFAQMEEEHMATLARRYHVQIPVPTGDFDVERAAIYADIRSRPADPVNLFRIAIAFEQRAVRFFTERAGVVDSGSAEQELYRALAAEEAEHVAVLTTELDRFLAGKAGLL